MFNKLDADLLSITHGSFGNMLILSTNKDKRNRSLFGKFIQNKKISEAEINDFLLDYVTEELNYIDNIPEDSIELSLSNKDKELFLKHYSNLKEKFRSLLK